MKQLLRSGEFIAVFFAAVLLTTVWCGATAPEADAQFMKQNAIAMDKMMKAMIVVPSGDVDADFVNMMEPHHQGAIDMAVLELRYGKNEQLHRIAQEIIVDQQQEITAMRLALHRPLPSARVTPDQMGKAASPSGANVH